MEGKTSADCCSLPATAPPSPEQLDLSTVNLNTNHIYGRHTITAITERRHYTMICKFTNL